MCKCFSYVLICTFNNFFQGKIYRVLKIRHRSSVKTITDRMSTPCFDPKRHFITNLKETPAASISLYTATTIGDDIYLIGGRDSGTFTNTVDQVTDTALKFSLSTKKWQELCPIPNKIVDHQAAAYKRVLYMCGGVTVLNGKPSVSRKNVRVRYGSEHVDESMRHERWASRLSPGSCGRQARRLRWQKRGIGICHNGGNLWPDNKSVDDSEWPWHISICPSCFVSSRRYHYCY